MRVLAAYHNECEGYHEYTGGCSVHHGFHRNSVGFIMTSPTVLMISHMSSILHRHYPA